MTGDSLPMLGIDSFSYHRYFGEVGEWEVPLLARWSTLDFLNRAAELDVDAVSLQTVYLEDLSRAAMEVLRAELADRGLIPVLAWGHRSGLASGASRERFEDALRTLDVAVDIGASLMRIVCGDQFSWTAPASKRKTRLAPILRTLASAAADRDMTMAIENHADFTMADLVDLIGMVEAPNLGICFDVGNTIRVGDDPVAAATLAAPLVRMVHVRDIAVQPDSKGRPAAWWPSVPLGCGDVAVAAVLERMGAPHGAGWFVEMSTMHPNHPDEDDAVRRSLAFLRDLAV